VLGKHEINEGVFPRTWKLRAFSIAFFQSDFFLPLPEKRGGDSPNDVFSPGSGDPVALLFVRFIGLFFPDYILHPDPSFPSSAAKEKFSPLFRVFFSFLKPVVFFVSFYTLSRAWLMNQEPVYFSRRPSHCVFGLFLVLV